MEEQLLHIKNEAMSMILMAEGDEIEQIYIDYLGKKGKLTLTLKEIPNLPVEKRSEVGRLANEIKNTIEEQINDRRSAIKKVGKKSSKMGSTQVDVSLPGIKPPVGSLHLVT